MGLTAPKERKYLSADALFGLLRNTFAQVPDHCSADAGIPLRDALMSGFAMFSLKCPSLLDFDKRRAEGNLHTIYGIECAPCDSYLREMLDPVSPRRFGRRSRPSSANYSAGKRLKTWCFSRTVICWPLMARGIFPPKRFIVRRVSPSITVTVRSPIRIRCWVPP